MADSRTFTLIGEFKDGITPELAKINKQLATLKAGFSGIGSRKNTGFRGATNDIGKLISAHKNLSASIKDVGSDLRSTIGVLQQYRREMGKAASATRSFQKSGGNLGSDAFAKNMRRANAEAQAYLRTLQQINRQSPRTVQMPTGGGGGGGRRGGGGGGGRSSPAGGMGAHMAEFGFAFTLGNALAQPIQNAVVSGFQIGIGLMTKPFEYFADKLKERIEDEQSDIKAAGGIFSIARRQKDPFVKTMDEAMEFTQLNNKYMAELADALPGNTQQYIEVSKRISDSISRIVMSDPTKAIAYSNKLREEEGKQALEGSRQAQTKGAITQLLGEMTKKTVLAGLGTSGGPGGVAGAYGLPQLTERMLTQQEVSMGQFQRYAAIFKDPLIMEALNRFIPKINASAAGTMERFEVMEKFYDEVLPKDMIRKFERSTAGVLELFNTTIFGPETGLFGLGRKMEGMGKVMDDYGNYIKVFEDGTRKVVSSMEEASDANLSLFDLLRDSFANLGIALYPILSNLSAIFDPINKVSKLLVDFRQSTGRFLNAFESYKKGFEDMVKGMDAASKKEFLKIGLDLRASLAAVNNFFANAGIINEAEFQKNAEQLMSKSFDYKGMMGGMLDTFLNSDVAGQLGEMIGKIIGTVLTEVAKITGFISGRIQSSNKLFDGLKKGFDDAGGTEAFKNIFKDVFKSLFKVLLEVMKIIPFEGYMLMAAMVVVPAAIQGLGMLIAEKMLAGLLLLKGKTGAMITKSFGSAATRVGKGGNTMRNLGAGFIPGTARQRVTTMRNMQQRGGQIAAGARAAATRRRAQMFGTNQYSAPIGPYRALQQGGGKAFMPSKLQGLPKAMKGIADFGKAAMPVAKKLPLLGIALGALDFGLRKAGGQGTGEAAGGAIGGVGGGAVGAVLGSALGPAGTVAGGILGAWLGDWLGSEIGKAIDSFSANFSSLPAKLDAGLWQVRVWFATLPESIGQWLGATYVKITTWFSTEIPKIGEWAKGQLSLLGNSIRVGFDSFVAKSKALLSDPAKWTQLVNSLIQSVVRAATMFNPATIVAAGFEIGKSLVSRLIEGFKVGAAVQRTTQAPPARTNQQTWGQMRYDGMPKASVPLGSAIASEMKNKPAGSDLVIANSSETVIPAAGGNGGGMVAFVETLRAGFEAVVGTYRQTSQQAQTHLTTQMTALGVTFKTAQERQRAEIAKISQTLVVNQQQTNAKLSALEKKFNAPAMPGGLGGGAAGGVDAFTPIASRMGLQLTSGYRPGDPGWHGANRARDYSNGTGPTPQMMQFAQHMAATYGSNLKELIYTPLGFSIKNGQRVAPYAQGAHYNHVHVAYAMGAGMPAFFSNQRDAVSWEKQHLGNGVRSITSNSVEVAGLLDGLFGRKPTPRKPGQKPTLDELGTGAGHGLLERRRRLEQEMIRMRGGRTSYMSPNGMSPSSSSLASAPINVTAPITINQQPGQNADELASIVAMKIGEAVADARAASIFV